MNLFDLSGRVAIVTGSSRGIGKAVAERFAEHGARVVISSRKQEACDSVAAAINAACGSEAAIAIAANISAKSDLQRLVEETQRRLGRILLQLHQLLGDTMLRDCTIERHNPTLDKVIGVIGELDERVKKVRLDDTTMRANQSAQFLRHFENMLALARVIATGARNRDESRGAHFKPEFPKRDDANWQRTTLAQYKGVGEVGFVREFDYTGAGNERIHVTDAVDVGPDSRARLDQLLSPGGARP